MEYVDRKEDPLIQVVRTHQHKIDSALLQIARCLKAEVQRDKNKREHSGENKRKMAREEDAWAIAM